MPLGDKKKKKVVKRKVIKSNKLKNRTRIRGPYMRGPPRIPKSNIDYNVSKDLSNLMSNNQRIENELKTERLLREEIAKEGKILKDEIKTHDLLILDLYNELGQTNQPTYAHSTPAYAESKSASEPVKVVPVKARSEEEIKQMAKKAIEDIENERIEKLKKLQRQDRLDLIRMEREAYNARRKKNK